MARKKINLKERDLNGLINKLVLLDIRTKSLQHKIESSYLKSLDKKESLSVRIRLQYNELLQLLSVRENYINLIANIVELQSESLLLIS